MATNSATWQEALALSEQLPVPDQLRLIAELSLRVRQALAETEPVDLLTLAGVGAEIWRKIDAEVYLNQERDSWGS